jgi:hypothetical protein
VGEVAHQLAVGLLLLDDARLARDPELLLEFAEFEQQAALAGLHGADHAVQVHRFAADVEQQVVVVESGLGPERLLELLEERRVARQRLVEGRSEQVLEPVGEQVFRGGIGVGHVEIFVEHQHGGRKQLESRIGRHDRVPHGEKAINAPAKEAGASAGCRKRGLLEARA